MALEKLYPGSLSFAFSKPPSSVVTWVCALGMQMISVTLDQSKT